MFEIVDEEIEDTFLKCFVSTFDGRLKTLDDLTDLGRNFFVLCLHLMFKEHSITKSRTCPVQQPADTFKWLKEYKDFNGKLTSPVVHKIMSNYKEENYIMNKGHLRDRILYILNSKLPYQEKNYKAVRNEVTEEIVERLKSGCGNHSNVEIANSLQLTKEKVKSYVKRYVIKFERNSSNCYFCHCRRQKAIDPTDYFRDTEARHERVKSSCGTHTTKEIADTLRISTSSVYSYIKAFDLNFEKNDNCYFCQCQKQLAEKPTDFKKETDERHERLKTNCGEHTNQEIGNFLGLSKWGVTIIIKKLGLEFVKNDDCYFCKMKEEGAPVILPLKRTRITYGKSEAIKTSCGDHSYQQMADSLGISKSAVAHRLRKEGIKKVKNGDCYFCQEIKEKALKTTINSELLKLNPIDPEAMHQNVEEEPHYVIVPHVSFDNSDIVEDVSQNATDILPDYYENPSQSSSEIPIKRQKMSDDTFDNYEDTEASYFEEGLASENDNETNLEDHSNSENNTVEDNVEVYIKEEQITD